MSFKDRLPLAWIVAAAAVVGASHSLARKHLLSSSNKVQCMTTTNQPRQCRQQLWKFKNLSVVAAVSEETFFYN